MDPTFLEYVPGYLSIHYSLKCEKGLPTKKGRFSSYDYWINEQFESSRRQPTVAVSQKLLCAALQPLTTAYSFRMGTPIAPILVLRHFRPYLRIWQAWNAENFHKLDQPKLWHNICFVARVTVCSVLLPTQGVLFLLNVLAADFDMRQFSINFPIMISIQSMAFAASVFFVKNRQIAAIVSQVQDVVANRECFRWCLNNFVTFSPNLIMCLVILVHVHDLAPFFASFVLIA